MKAIQKRFIERLSKNIRTFRASFSLTLSIERCKNRCNSKDNLGGCDVEHHQVPSAV